MTIEQPFAGRLLNRLVPAQDHDALLGDLNRRTSTWAFPRLVLGADPCAIGFGSASLIMYFVSVSPLINTVTRRLYEGILVGDRWIYWRPWPGTFASQVVPMLFFHAGFVVSGWVIARLNRAHGITSAAAFAAFVGSLFLAFYVVGYILLALYVFGHIHVPGVRAAADNSHDTYFSPVWMVVCIVIGGYFATRRAEAK